MTVYLGTYVGRAPPICKSKKVIDETKKCEEIFLANFLRGNSCHPLPILTVITKSHFWKQIKGKRVALKSNKTCWKKSNMKNSSALVRTELVVMGDNSCLRGPGFKSQRNLLDVHDIFSTLMRCKNCIVCLKRPKMNEKTSPLGWLWWGWELLMQDTLFGAAANQN